MSGGQKKKFLLRFFLTGCIVLFAAFALFIWQADLILHGIVQKELQRYFLPRLDIQAPIRIRWFPSPSISLQQVSLTDETQQILQAQHIALSIDANRLIRGEVLIRDILLDDITLHIQRTKDNHWNLSSLLIPQSQQKSPPDTPWQWNLPDMQNIRLENSRIIVEQPEQPILTIKIAHITVDKLMLTQTGKLSCQIQIDNPSFSGILKGHTLLHPFTDRLTLNGASLEADTRLSLDAQDTLALSSSLKMHQANIFFTGTVTLEQTETALDARTSNWQTSAMVGSTQASWSEQQLSVQTPHLNLNTRMADRYLTTNIAINSFDYTNNSVTAQTMTMETELYNHDDPPDTPPAIALTIHGDLHGQWQSLPAHWRWLAQAVTLRINDPEKGKTEEIDASGTFDTEITDLSHIVSRFDGHVDTTPLSAGVEYRRQATPPLAVTLSATQLDLDRYLPATSTEKAVAKQEQGAWPTVLAPWRTWPLVLHIQVQKIRFRDASAENISLSFSPDTTPAPDEH